MAIFTDYACYYDLLYRDKDYAGETDFILEILKENGCIPQTLLDLGCGTGRHAIEMTKKGIKVTGVDLSETMLDMGQKMLEGLNPANFNVNLPELFQADARNVRLKKKFDAVVSLFHVMSYQNTEEDAMAVMQTAKEHLNPGGLFLFDFWYGPGVLTETPDIRKKTIEDSETRVIRLATPVHRVNDNMVEVHYEVSFIDIKTGSESSISECHNMRYWFLPELRYFTRHSGFSMIADGEWMTENPLNIKTWNGYACLCSIR